MSTPSIPPRVLQRPSPADWSLDELMNLDEAASLFWPDGPLTVSSLRTAVRDRRLAVCRIAGKMLTSRRSIEAMSNCAIDAAKVLSEPERQTPKEAALARLAAMGRGQSPRRHVQSDPDR